MIKGEMYIIEKIVHTHQIFKDKDHNSAAKASDEVNDAKELRTIARKPNKE